MEELQTEKIIHHKSFVLLILGSIVSNIGSAIHIGAIGWYIMTLADATATGRLLSYYGISTLIPVIIFGTFGGVIVDRFNRKWIIVWTDIIRGGLIILMGLLIKFGFFPFVSIIAISSICAILNSLFNSAIDASIPNIVDDYNLQKANSINELSGQLTFMIGLFISGFLYSYLGIAGIVFLNGISFILSGISEMFIKMRKCEVQQKAETSMYADFKDGIMYIMNKTSILTLLSFIVFFNFLFNPALQIVLPKVIKFNLGLEAQSYGLLRGIMLSGGVFGMVVLSIIPQPKKIFRSLFLSILIFSVLFSMLSIPLLPLLKNVLSDNMKFAIICFIGFLLMACGSFCNIPFMTMMQKIIPDDMRGRFFSTMNSLSQAVVPFGMLIIGFVADFSESYIIFLVCGLLSLCLCILLLRFKDIKEI
ncbi:MFS transporter [Helicovermis profundi]|uniref:MFS transporter n=1 Tax=Helicovermis profundi TaxID=3065157 RepID=A0AAU9EJF0_9FIRM|nr:MFS transporter [Clostridia bacterium S502]